MANWWMPVAQLRVMRRMAAGEVLVRNAVTGKYKLIDSKGFVTVPAKALSRKNFISDSMRLRRDAWVVMEMTPTGRNELGYNRHREID